MRGIPKQYQRQRSVGHYSLASVSVSKNDNLPAQPTKPFANLISSSSLSTILNALLHAECCNRPPPLPATRECQEAAKSEPLLQVISTALARSGNKFIHTVILRVLEKSFCCQDSAENDEQNPQGCVEKPSPCSAQHPYKESRLRVAHKKLPLIDSSAQCEHSNCQRQQNV